MLTSLGAFLWKFHTRFILTMTGHLVAGGFFVFEHSTGQAVGGWWWLGACWALFYLAGYQFYRHSEEEKAGAEKRFLDAVAQQNGEIVGLRGLMQTVQTQSGHLVEHVTQLNRESERLGKELEAEIARNGKPELRVSIIGAVIMRSSFGTGGRQGSRQDDTSPVMDMRDHYVTVTFELFNSRGLGTIDRWLLAVEGRSAAPLAAESLLLYPKRVSADLTNAQPPNVLRVERNFEVPNGQTVTRWEYFVFTEITEAASQQVGPKAATNQESSMYPEPLPDGMSVRLTVVDSFGGVWKSEPWPMPQPQIAATAQP